MCSTHKQRIYWIIGAFYTACTMLNGYGVPAITDDISRRFPFFLLIATERTVLGSSLQMASFKTTSDTFWRRDESESETSDIAEERMKKFLARLSKDGGYLEILIVVHFVGNSLFPPLRFDSLNYVVSRIWKLWNLPEAVKPRIFKNLTRGFSTHPKPSYSNLVVLPFVIKEVEVGSPRNVYFPQIYLFSMSDIHQTSAYPSGRPASPPAPVPAMICMINVLN